LAGAMGTSNQRQTIKREMSFPRRRESHFFKDYPWDSPLQGAHRLVSQCRSAGERYIARNPCFTLPGNDNRYRYSNCFHVTSPNVVVHQVSAVPAVAAAEAEVSKADKKRNLSELRAQRGRVISFPALDASASGTRRAAALRSPSFAYFSWRDKKSERLPGYLQYAHWLASQCRSAGGRHAVRIPSYAPRQATAEWHSNRTPERKG
jgi:hypothetical protein